MKNRAFIKEMLLVLSMGLLSAFLLFWPSLSKLGGKNNSFFGQLYESFFHTHRKEALLGDGVDPLGSFWIVGFVEDILGGKRSSIAPELYAPFGLDLGVHEGYAWLDTLFAMPLRWLIGSPGFYNLHVFCTLLLSFCACYLLFRKVGQNQVLALLFAHLCVVNEFVYQEISYGRPTQSNWLFGALFVWSSFSLLKNKKSIIWAVLSGLFLGAFCLIYWFGAAGLGFGMALVLFYDHIREKKWLLGLRNAALLIASTSLVVLPITWRAVKPILSGKGSKAYSHLLNSPTDNIDLLLFSFPIYSSEIILSFSDLWIFIKGRHYPYFLLLTFVLTLLFTLYKRKFFWAVILCIVMMLPIGSALTLFSTVIPTSYALLEWIFPPLVRCNFPDRLMLTPLLMVFCAVLWIFRTEGTALLSRLGAKVGLPILLLLLGINLWHVWGSHTPAIQIFEVNKALVTTAKSQPGGFIEFPYTKGNDTYVQTEFHRQQILTGPGMMMIHPPESKRYLKQNKLLLALEKINTRGFSPADKIPIIDLLELQKDGFRHLVLYLDKIKQPVGVFERYLRNKGKSYPKYGVHIIQLPDLK